jgi:hypothetical protein
MSDVAPPPVSRATVAALVALAVALAAIVTAVAVLGGPDDAATRQEEVAARGALVMPFDLETTTHVFEKTDAGGVQVVRADDDADDEQLPLIREHLEAEAARFAAGDFADPASIHGDDMAGLEVLQRNVDAIDVVYEETDDGGRITYTSDDPAVVDAIHQWFDAQLADHGDHATGG